MAQIGLVGYSLMQSTFWLLIAHTFGILVASAFAVANIRSIVVSGPVLSATGGLIALISYRWDRSIGFVLGLAAPTLSVTCLLLICLLELSPAQAHAPVGTVLVLFSIASVAACPAALRELSQASEADRPTNPIQYSIAGLLLTMFATSAILSLGQTAGAKAATLGVFLAYLVLLVYVVVKFFRSRRLERQAGVPRNSVISAHKITPDSP